LPPGTAGARAAERPAPDRAWLERVRAGEPEALGPVYAPSLHLVVRLALRRLGERTLAEDAASEVFLKVHRAADRLDPARDPAPWLATITTNVCRDVWRSGQYRMSRRAPHGGEPA